MFVSTSVRHYTVNPVWHQVQVNQATCDMMLATVADASVTNSPCRRTTVPFSVVFERCVITIDADVAPATGGTYRILFYKPSLSGTNIYPTVFASRTLTAMPNNTRETAQAFAFTGVQYNVNEGMSIRVQLVSDGSTGSEYILSLYGYQVD